MATRPRRATGPLARAPMAALVAGLVVAALWFGSRPGAQALALQEVAERGRVEAGSQAVHAEQPVRRTGNVTYLAPAAFEARGELPAPGAPVPLTLTASGKRSGDRQLLAEDEGQVTGTPTTSLPTSRLGELVVSGVLSQGSRLMIDIVSAGKRPRTTSLAISLTPSPEPQVLRVVRPLGLPTGHAEDTVASVVLRHAEGEDVRCRIDGVVLVDAWQTYRDAAWGQERFTLGRTTRQACWQSVDGTLRLPLDAQAPDLFKTSLALRHGSEATRARWTVSAEAADGGLEVLDSGEVPADTRWHDLRIALPSPRPRALLLECQDLPPDGVLAWAGLRLVDTTRAPQRVLITLMDTLRADMVGALAESAPPTPHLDALAQQGVVFESCISQSYWTRPSMASIMSGRYVQATGVHQSHHRLPSSYPTVAEAFLDAGYFTVGTMSNSNAASDAGLERGWAEMTEQWVTPALTEADDYLRTLVEPRLAGVMDEDLVVYVHLMDAHGPYGPAERPEDWSPAPGRALAFDEHLDRPWHEAPTDASRVELYRSDVTRLDAGWGAFLERTLARWEVGEGPGAIVAVVSDHGEFLGEHDQWSHGPYGLLPALVHVPLLLRAPGRVPAGARVSGLVQNVDLGPTLLELAGVDLPVSSGWDGTSLVAAAHGGPVRAQALVSGGATASLFAIYSDGGALVGRGDDVQTVLDDRHGTLPEEPTPDGEHGSPFALTPPAFVESSFQDARRVYRERGDAVRDALWSHVDPATRVVDPDVLRQLVELGYVQR
jgi:arylsulfatase A-like enzyme